MREAMYGAVRKGVASGGDGRAAPYDEKSRHSDGDREGSWTCRHCSNVNYAIRDVCNTRKCAQHRSVADIVLNDSPEGSWFCLGCENVNYPSRTVCNTKRCALPRPMAFGAPALASPGGKFGLAHANISLGAQPLLARGLLSLEVAADWTCGKCGNVNFGHREVCNTRTCQAPRDAEVGRQLRAASSPRSHVVGMPPAAAGDDWTCPGCGNLNFGHRTVCNTRTCQAPRGGVVAASDWTCPACGNLNFASRDVCNTRTCRMPRVACSPVVSTGRATVIRAPASVNRSLSQPPPLAAMHNGQNTSWSCPACGNVNYGHRELCNTRTCQHPKPEATPDDVSGNWRCEGCGNLNFAHRAVCNTRKCQLPRPE